MHTDAQQPHIGLLQRLQGKLAEFTDTNQRELLEPS